MLTRYDLSNYEGIAYHYDPADHTHSASGEPIYGGASTGSVKPDGYLEYDETGTQAFVWVGGKLVRAPEQDKVKAAPTPAKPARTPAEREADARAALTAIQGQAGWKVTQVAGSIFDLEVVGPDGKIYRMSWDDTDRAFKQVGSPTTITPKTEAQSRAERAAQQAGKIAAYTSGQRPGNTQSAGAAEQGFVTAGSGGAPGTPESNPMLYQDVWSEPNSKLGTPGSYFGTWTPAGGGSQLTQAESINSSNSTLAALGFAIPSDPQERVAQELMAGQALASVRSLKPDATAGDVAAAAALLFKSGGKPTTSDLNTVTAPISDEDYYLGGAADGGNFVVNEPTEATFTGLHSGRRSHLNLGERGPEGFFVNPGPGVRPDPWADGLLGGLGGGLPWWKRPRRSLMMQQNIAPWGEDAFVQPQPQQNIAPPLPRRRPYIGIPPMRPPVTERPFIDDDDRDDRDGRRRRDRGGRGRDRDRSMGGGQAVAAGLSGAGRVAYRTLLNS